MKLAEKTRYQVRAAVVSDIPQLTRIQFEEQKEMLHHVGMTPVSLKELTRTRDSYRVQIEDKEAKLVVAEDEESGMTVGNRCHAGGPEHRLAGGCQRNRGEAQRPH
jgi:hypothetical protein